MPRPILVSIEGNIGSGKSTLLDTLKKEYPHYHYIPEPVSEWFTYTNDCGKNILELFYQDKQRYAYTFQTMAFITRVINISNAIKEWEAACAIDPTLAEKNVFITERCIETDYNVFAKMLYDDKVINKVEMDLYLTWFNHLKERCEITGVVHVTTPPTICRERISIRNRSGEEGIPMEYLTSLDHYHDKWLKDFEVPILRYVNVGDVQNCVADVAAFISTL
jgi:deoxyadenosine/deoxycytidine kinase